LIEDSLMAAKAGTTRLRTTCDADDLVLALQRQAEERRNQIAFIFLRDGETEDASITYGELDRRARAVAARLQAMGLAGAKALLAYPPGLDFIAGLFGCLYAGCVAVPTSLAQRRRRLERFDAIVTDAQAEIVLSTAEAADRWARSHGTLLSWIATEGIEDEWAERWHEGHVGDPSAQPGRTSLAMLQYTSGSTSEPKGVMLSHGNLVHNTRAICDAFGVWPPGANAEKAVFWLPTYHDMGLVGGVMTPIFSAITNVTMSPTTFLQSPITWLRAISTYRATISGGPNFAYDLCVRKITEDQKAGLDLSSWSLAFVGAEPVQAETLERFAAAFAPCGFNASAFYPCYGLAEATLMVTGPKRGEGAVVRGGAARTGRPDSPSRQLVACGSPVGESRVVIVDPRAGVELAPGQIGEIWVAGPSVAQGYWNRPLQTRRAFGASLSPRSGPFLRTGDLGFIDDGRLYVTGRSDDLIIIRGVNHYPQDIEATARQSHPLLAHQGGAAFAIADEGSHRHVLVHEVTRNGMKDYAPVLEAAAKAVLDEHDVSLDAIVLVRSGTIPRTSSGKVQRRVCRDTFLAGALHVVAERSNGHAPMEAKPVSPDGKAAQDRSDVFAVICEQVRALERATPHELSPETPISALGLDSLQRVELFAALERAIARRLPSTCNISTLGELERMLQDDVIDCSPNAGAIGSIPPGHYDIASFPEHVELSQHESMVCGVVGESPYFRVDIGTPGRHSPESGGAALCIDGRNLVNFCSYDYLGLSRHAMVAAAAREAIDRYGTSAGASRLVSGEKQLHRDLEEALAGFLGTKDAIAFVSGHATNVTTIGHLVDQGDLIVHDALAHNSIIQGALLSGASRRSFPHNDWKSLDALLSEIRHRYRRVLVAIEGVYSMDGDWPDLPRFVEIRRKYKTLLLVDEAHSLGVMGKTGRGMAEHCGVARSDADLWMGTLSKSLASCGGFIAGSAELVKYLKYTAPGFVYSVGLSPPNTAAALASVRILEREPHRVARLRENALLFMKLAHERGLDTGLAMPGAPVVPVIVGSSTDSLRLSHALFQRGINVQPILRPAVPEETARLRFFVTINHSESQIRTAVDAVATELARLRGVTESVAQTSEVGSQRSH
jgi:8-amino-7-oxononanoate synthase